MVMFISLLLLQNTILAACQFGDFESRNFTAF